MPKRHHQPVGELQRAEHHHQAGRHERQADLEGAVAQHLLEVERGQEEPGEHRGGPEHADHLRDGHVAQLEQPQRHQRLGRLGLADHEGDEQHGRWRPSRPRVRWSSRRRCRRRWRRQRSSGPRSPGPRPARRAWSSPAPRRRTGSTARAARMTAMPTGTFTRKIQCQENSPVRTPPRRTPTAPPPDITKPKTPIALARSPGSVNRPMISASATAETAAPARPCTARPTTRSARCGARPQAAEAMVNGDDAAEEDPLVAEQVAEPAGQEQEAAEGQQVGVDHPGQRRLREAEVGADRGQRDVHDALVEHDHQVAQAEHVEGQPAAPRRLVGVRSLRGGWWWSSRSPQIWKGLSLPRTGVDKYDRPCELSGLIGQPIPPQAQLRSSRLG